MKYWIYIVSTALTLGCYENKPDVITGLEGKRIPSFSILLMDSVTRIATDSLPFGAPIVVLLFNPNCPYCRAETRDILYHIKTLKNIRFYFLSFSTFISIRKFSKEFGIANYPNVIVGQDDKVIFANYYKVRAVPYTAVYTGNKLLKHAFIGRVGILKLKNSVL